MNCWPKPRGDYGMITMIDRVGRNYANPESAGIEDNTPLYSPALFT